MIHFYFYFLAKRGQLPQMDVGPNFCSKYIPEPLIYMKPMCTFFLKISVTAIL